MTTMLQLYKLWKNKIFDRFCCHSFCCQSETAPKTSEDIRLIYLFQDGRAHGSKFVVVKLGVFFILDE